MKDRLFSLETLVNIVLIIGLLVAIIGTVLFFYNGFKLGNAVSCEDVIINKLDTKGHMVVDSFSKIPSKCKNEFVSFYDANDKGDIGIAWEKFKQFKLNQMEE